MKWPTKKLGEIAQFINGRAFKSKEWATVGLPIIRIQNLNNPDAEYNYFTGTPEAKYVVDRGDILISWSASLGVYCWSGPKAVLNQHIFKVIPDEKLVDCGFFFYLATSLLEEMKRRVHGGTMQHITKSAFENISFSLPPLAEQKKILGILEEADRLRKLRKQANDRMRDFLPALFLKMFGDPRTNPKGWPISKLGEVCEIYNGATPRRSREDYWKGGTIPWFTIADIRVRGHFISDTEQKITKKALEDTNVKLLPVNSILLSCTATIGEVAMNQIQMTTNQQFNGLVIKNEYRTRILPMYLLHLALGWKSELAQLGGTTSFNFISTKNLKSIKVVLPPLGLQRQFFDIVQEAEAQIATQAKATTRIDDLFRSLLHNAFT